MRRNPIPVALLIIVPLLAMTLAAQVQTEPTQQTTAPEPAGKKIFLEKKCNLCHSIAEQGIEMTVGGFAKGEKGEKNVPPDLSGIGAKYKTDWMMKYLKKQEAREGVKHAKTFIGKDEDLAKLAEWLESLKKKE